MFERKYILGETGIVVMGENGWMFVIRKVKMISWEFGPDKNICSYLKKIFPETPPPYLMKKMYKKYCQIF